MGHAVEKRLEYLRGELRAGNMSYGELAELQSLAPYIEAGDVELLEAAGVPEHEGESDEAAADLFRYLVITVINGCTDMEYFSTLPDARKYAAGGGTIYREVK